MPSVVFACLMATAAADMPVSSPVLPCLEILLCAGVENCKPVRVLKIRRTVRERHKIERLMRAGRECHESMSVPATSIVLLVVIRESGGKVNPNQIGVASEMRTKRVVRAGLVVAEVAVRWMDRKSVRRSIGSRRMLHRVVKVCRAAKISSRDLRCLTCTLACSFWSVFCFSPVQPVEESGE